MTGTELTPNWGLDHFDPWERRISYGNIWGIYSAMREKAAAHFSDAHGGFWSIVRYKDVKAAARDHRTFSSAGGTSIGERRNDSSAPAKAPIEYDPPEHTRYRKAMQEPFLPRKMEEFTAGIRSSVNELMDQISEMGEFDIVKDLAEPVPQEVLSKIIGFDDETKVQNRELVLAVVNADLETKPVAWSRFHDFLRGEIRNRQARPREDFLSHLCIDEFEGAKFSENELVSMLAALALAGHHTAINGISSVLRRVANEDVRNSYLADRNLLPKIIEETLRCDPPIHLEGRTTTEPVVVDGVKIPANASVALVYASANHDGAEFSDPESFDLNRGANQHLTFGHGIHTCFGMHLARLEMSIVVEEMIRKFPHYRLTGPQIDTGMIYGHHMGWESMPASID
ncbi:MAG: cytochrome P450 [Actinomycetota bacterium]|nr:MAG: cytochrome P450 [Actinomycetota bacterium]